MHVRWKENVATQHVIKFDSRGNDLSRSNFSFGYSGGNYFRLHHSRFSVFQCSCRLSQAGFAHRQPLQPIHDPAQMLEALPGRNRPDHEQASTQQVVILQ